MVSAAAASSALFYANPTLHAGFQDRRAKTPTAEFLHLSAKFSYGLPTSAFRVLKYPSRLRQNLGSMGRPRRTPGVAYATAATEKRVHDFTVKDIDGKDVSLNKFKGKILLIVNVASRCGLTSSNYSELSHIYEKYKTQGFEVLAFPCNQFGGQEPGSNSEIKQFACTRFKADFPIFDKVDVNGPNAAPVYQFLKSSAGGFLGDLIKWNFEKFLVDKNGKVVERYPPTTSPFQIEVLENPLRINKRFTLGTKHRCVFPFVFVGTKKDIQKLLAA